MPLLFSYGTLQQVDVQFATFGRRLEGVPDELPGYEPSLSKIEDPALAERLGRTHHDNARFNGRHESRVRGTAFQVTDAELAQADEYERVARYHRISVKLASGRQSWVYVDTR